MKKMKFLALLCAAALAALTMISCGGEPVPTPEPEPDPDPTTPKITISSQPQSVTVTEGEITASLAVTATVTEDATLSYQWFSNTTASSEGGTAVGGATSTSFAIPTDLTEGAYYYFVEVSATGDAAAVRSSVATVTVSLLPVPVITITTHPTDKTFTEGEITGNLTVEAEVTEDATLTYQWYSNTTASNTGGTEIEGAAAANFTIPTDLAPGEHHYFVEVRAEGASSVRSNPATVTVEALPKPTERYLTVPYDADDFPVPTGARTMADGDKDYVLVYSTRDDNNNYYVFYAGRIEHTPLLYQQAIYYNGITPITVGYSKTVSVETSVMHGIEKATTESIETSNTLGLTVGVSASVGFGGTGIEVSTEISTSVSRMLGTSVSTSSTVETTEGLVEGETFSTEATIGTAGEPVGMYRYALFATGDVFYNVTQRRDTKAVIDITVSLCARSRTYWGIDYDPDFGEEADFDKTAEGPMLELPEFQPEDMPDISHILSPGIEVRVGNVIWAGANVGEKADTFAADASKGGVVSYGGFYQFGRKRAWPTSGSVSGWDSSIPSVTSWSSFNDPCPAGWRVPSESEWVALYNARDGETIWDGRNGSMMYWKLKNGAGTIYLPAAGERDYRDGSSFAPGSIGGYWSSTGQTTGDQTTATMARFSSGDYGFIFGSSEKTRGCTIRCVRPAN